MLHLPQVVHDTILHSSIMWLELWWKAKHMWALRTVCTIGLSATPYEISREIFPYCSVYNTKHIVNLGLELHNIVI